MVMEDRGISEGDQEVESEKGEALLLDDETEFFDWSAYDFEKVLKQDFEPLNKELRLDTYDDKEQREMSLQPLLTVEEEERTFTTYKPGSQNRLLCILHKEGAKEGEVRPITPQVFKRLKSVANARRKTKSAKYRKIVQDFPMELEEIHGYHAQCYEEFTAVTPKILSLLPPSEEVFETHF